MSHEPDPSVPTEAKPEHGSLPPEAPVGEASAPTPPPASVEQKLAEATAESARLRDQLLRTAADFDNFRKRARKSEDDAHRRGREQLLKDLLPVFDNLERALQHAPTSPTSPTSSASPASPEAQTFASGLRMVLKQFLDTLERTGVKRVVTVGQGFDPTRHEAIQHLESAEHPAGVVIAEVQPGYVIGDSLVRAALVVVSKGAPASTAASSGASTGASTAASSDAPAAEPSDPPEA